MDDCWFRELTAFSVSKKRPLGRKGRVGGKKQRQKTSVGDTRTVAAPKQMPREPGAPGAPGLALDSRPNT